LIPKSACAWSGLPTGYIISPRSFPAWEQQRVAIARAVVKRPEVLLCDEPTGALDYVTGKLVLEVLDRINRELQTITAVITHNAAIAAMADRVIRISNGLIAEVRKNERRASPEELRWWTEFSGS
jgi:putative ABC transport system ATP-binding protein